MKMPELLYNHILSRNIELKYKTLFYVKEEPPSKTNITS